MITPRAKPDAPQAILPSGAVSIFGADNLHHGDIIGRVFVTPDGRHAVSLGSADHTPEDRIRTKLWDLETGKALVLAGGKLPAVPGGVKVVAAAPVGKSLALVVVPQDRIKAGEAGWWFIDAISGEVLAEFPRTTVWGRSDIDPVGNRIATVTAHGKQPNDPQEYKILLWEVGKKQEPTELLPPQRHRVHKIQFAPDGRHLAVQYADGTQLEILDATTRKVVLAVPDSDPTGRTFDCFAFSPDGRLFAKEDQNNKTLRVWTLADGKERPAFLCEDGNWGHPVVFDSTGTHLGHLSTRGKFQLYSLATGELVWEVPCKGGFLTGFDAAFTSDGMWLVTAEREDLVVRDAKTGKVRDTANHTADISHLAWSRDGKRVVTLDGDSGTLGRVWNAESGRQAATIAGHADRYAALAASPDESVFATSGARSRRDAGDTSVRLWSAADGREIASFQPKLENTEFGVRHLWFAPDGKTLFGLARELGFVWDVSGKRELRSFAHPFAYVSGAYPLAGGQRVLLCGWLPHADGSPTSVTEDPLIVLTMDLKTGNEIGPRVDFGRDGLRGASWDGRFVIRTWYASPSDHRAEVWDLTGACSLGRLSGSNGSESPWVTTGLFSPNARTFSVGYSDGTVRVYEWATRTECLRFSHGASVQSLAYSPDGSRLASTGSRWGLVWDLTAPQVMKPASDTDAWSALAKNDGRSGLAAARYWAERPAEAVPYFTSRLRPVPAVDPKKVADWIEQLGSESFAEREAATKQLSGVGDAARHQFSAAIAKLESPEARNRLATIAAALGDDRPLTGDLLRAVRTVELLETFETPQAREVLKALAGGAPDARLTRSAAAALTRLKNRK